MSPIMNLADDYASDILCDVSGFTSVLDSDDTSVQKSLDAIDDWGGSVNSSISSIETDLNGFPDSLKDLTADEITQYKNMNTTTVSVTQWGYLGAMDQGVKTTDDVTFREGIFKGTTDDDTAYALRIYDSSDVDLFSVRNDGCFEGGQFRTINTSIFIGDQAGVNDDGTTNRNLGIGESSLQDTTSGFENTAVGFYSMRYNTAGLANTAIGRSSLESNLIGQENTALGRYAMRFNSDGSLNVAVGQSAFYNGTTNTYGIAIGWRAGYSASQTGGIFMGRYAGNSCSGNYNVYIGHHAGLYHSTGSQNVLIGGFASCLAYTDDNEIVIGYSATGKGSNTVTIGQSITHNYFEGEVYTKGTTDDDTAYVLNLENNSESNIISIRNDGLVTQVGDYERTGNLKQTGGSVWVDGTTGATPTSGAGTRFMYVPARDGALRAGVAYSDYWDNSNIGNGSICVSPYRSRATGTGSACFGWNCRATANYTFATGYYSGASANSAVAMGSNCSASGTNAIALGDGCSASGDDSVAIGEDCQAFANSISIGRDVSSATTYKFFGFGQDISGGSSTRHNAVAVGRYIQIPSVDTIMILGMGYNTSNKLTCPATSQTFALGMRSNVPSIILDGSSAGVGTPATVQVGGASNYAKFDSNGDLSFIGTAGFYPVRISQSAQPTPDTGEMVLWRDTDDDKVYVVYTDTDVGTKIVELT